MPKPHVHTSKPRFISQPAACVCVRVCVQQTHGSHMQTQVALHTMCFHVFPDLTHTAGATVSEPYLPSFIVLQQRVA